jgi:hypothetical protein
MLEFLKGKRTSVGPHDFVAEIEIERPASAVYPLLDLADPLFTKRQLGDQVKAVPGQPDTFHLVVKELPDVTFALKVTAAVPGSEFAFDCLSSQQLGRVARSHEHYHLEELGPELCRLVLTNTVEFAKPLRNFEAEEEAILLSIAGYNALAKIKVHAEHGTAAVEAMSAEFMLGLG